MNEEIKDKILEWFANGEVGASSKAMACDMLGIAANIDYPRDPPDFNRCLKFLAAVPEARECMDSFAELSPVWKALIKHWKEIELCFLKEVGFDWTTAHHAEETYRLMQKIINEALCDG